jgi:hypothetical protein
MHLILVEEVRILINYSLVLKICKQEIKCQYHQFKVLVGILVDGVKIAITVNPIRASCCQTIRGSREHLSGFSTSDTCFRQILPRHSSALIVELASMIKSKLTRRPGLLTWKSLPRIMPAALGINLLYFSWSR